MDKQHNLRRLNKEITQEFEQRGRDIESLATKVVELAAANDKLLAENKKLKSHWAYKLTHLK